MAAGSLRPYVVRQGDHLIALAGRYGFEPDDVWNDPKNADLKKARGDDGHVLLSGDLLYIPEVKRTWLPVTIGSTNAFRAKSNLVNVSVRFVADGKPLAGEAYVIEGAQVDPGALDGDGNLHVKVPARTSIFTIRFIGRNEAYFVKVGHLDPHDTASGVRMRLALLGFYGRGHLSCSDDAGDLEFGLRQFQLANALDVTGELDDVTIAKLFEIFGR